MDESIPDRRVETEARQPEPRVKRKTRSDRTRPSPATGDKPASPQMGALGEPKATGMEFKPAVPKDTGYDLHEPTPAEFGEQDPEALSAYYVQVQSDYFLIVDEYLEQANLAARQFKKLSLSYSRWRLGMVVATGILAAINVTAAFELLGKFPKIGGDISIPALLNAIAALYAGCLTIANNIENLFNKGQKAAGFRESRELLLTAYREYYFRWSYYVIGFGVSTKSCINAGRLYHQLIDFDRELRAKLKQLTEVPENATAKIPASRNGNH